MKKSTQEIVRRTRGRDTGTAVVNNADGSGSTSGYNADGTSYATVTNADGSGSSRSYYQDGKLGGESVTHADGSNVAKSYYDNANNSLYEVRCEVAANDAEGRIAA